MEEEDVSLFDLLNSAIGTPQIGAVNFSALHVLLHAVLTQLDIREVKTVWKDVPPGEVHPDAPMGANQEHRVQEQESQPVIELQGPGPSASSPTPEADDQKLLSRIQSCEDGLSKAMTLIHELHNQKDNLKKEMEELRHLQKTPFTDVEKCCHRVDALEDTVRSLTDSFLKYPEELSQCVTWDVMQSTLLANRENLQKDPVNSELVDAATSSPFSSSTHLVQDLGSPAAGLSGPTSISTKEAPSVPLGHRQLTHPETVLTTGKTTGSERYQETVEALRDVGKLKERFSKLEARVAALEKGKADQTQLTHLRELISNKGSQDASKNLMDQRAVIDDLRSDQEKSVELVNTVQMKILQIQAECEKLHETTRSLQDDSRQKQSLMEELYKTTEELQEKKADKQMVESEINKADKSEKVSRLQFDSATEELNAMFHELLNKVTDQEQDWHKVVERLSTEMECKLNRIELDSVKKQLEDRWRNIQAKLQVQGAPEQEDAAAVRKQLVDRFHCLSCDRPVVMHSSGQHLVKLPSTAGFPSHRSMRPFTVYALEQLRQHYRSDRISEMTDYTHLVSRSCGGSHTVTSAGQRRSGLQHLKHHVQPEGDAVVQSEVDIVGLDGHIYKGRLNTTASRNTETKLPTISTKEGKTKDKVKNYTSHKAAAVSPEPHQPFSAKSSQSSHSASSCSGRDWPVSALGCPSQSSVTPASAAADVQADDTLHQ